MCDDPKSASPLTTWSALVLGVLAPHLAAQAPTVWPSSVRTWGRYNSDTEGREGRFVSVAAGWDLTGVVRADGRVFLNGQDAYRTFEVPAAAAGTHYVDIAVMTYGMGLLSDGSIVLWGLSSMIPPAAPPLPVGVKYISMAAGSAHALAIRSDGVLVAWGQPAYNIYGQQTVPPQVTQGTVRKCRAGGSPFSLALLANGTIVAWGDNSYGQCSVPLLPSGVTYVDMYAGVRHSVAVRSDGQAVAWGENIWGQCNVPPLPPGCSYLMASAGLGHSHAVRSDGVFVTWGNQSLHQGDVAPIPTGDRCVQMASGMNHTVALLASGRVLAWGANEWLQAYTPSLPDRSPRSRWVAAAAGANHNLALTAAGELIGWGRVDWGITQVPAALQGMSWQTFGCGYLHNVALARDGTLHAWGDNTSGQCNVPPLPPGVLYTPNFSVGPGHNVALRSDGAAVAFGDNSWGCSQLPTPPLGKHYVDADCNYGKTVLLRSDNTIIDIGNPYWLSPPPPVAPAGLAFVEVAAAEDFGAALLSDGSVALWGQTSLPAPLPSLPFGVGYVELDAGLDHVVLRRSDGNVDVIGFYAPQGPPLEPGTSYVKVSASDNTITARVGPTCTYVSLAPGCAGSLPATRLIPRDTPRIGKTLEVTLFDLPQNIAFLVFGWQRIPTVDLGFVGMPGCNLHISLDAIVPLVGTNQQAKWELPIPNSAIWVGTRFYNQALVLDPAAGNGFGAVVSDAAEAVIGSW